MLCNGWSRGIDFHPVFSNVVYNERGEKACESLLRLCIGNAGMRESGVRAPQNARAWKIMRSTMNQPRAVVRALYSNSVNFLSTFSVTSRFGKQISAGAIGLGLLFVVAASSQAQSPTNYWWTGSGGDGVWENANNWVLSNDVATTTWPGVLGANSPGTTRRLRIPGPIRFRSTPAIPSPPQATFSVVPRALFPQPRSR